jgi:hypothetical protein
VQLQARPRVSASMVYVIWVDQNHTYICICMFGVHTVFLAGKSTYIYMVHNIRFWPTLHIIVDSISGACVPSIKPWVYCEQQLQCDRFLHDQCIPLPLPLLVSSPLHANLLTLFYATICTMFYWNAVHMSISLFRFKCRVCSCACQICY